MTSVCCLTTTQHFMKRSAVDALALAGEKAKRRCATKGCRAQLVSCELELRRRRRGEAGGAHEESGGSRTE